MEKQPFFAVEHQRGDARFIVLRQLDYCVRIWTRWLKDNPRATHLPPIIPVLVHSGDRPWRSPTRLRDLSDLRGLPRNAGLLSMMPSLRVVLADLAGPRLTRARLCGAGLAPVSGALLKILQAGPRAEAPDLFDEWTSRLAPLRDEPAGGSTLCAALWHLFYVSAVPKDRIIAAAETLPEPEKERFMTGAQQCIAEGRQLGRDEGRLEGRLEGRAEGTHLALASAVCRLATRRFGDLPPAIEAQIRAASTDDLERWLDRLLTAERLSDLFG